MKQNLSKTTLSEYMDAIVAIVMVCVGSVVLVYPFVVHIISTVSSNWAAMLIIGLMVPPVGWVHGVGIIFGWW